MSDLTPSNQRAIPLAARKDIQAHQATYLGQACWVIKDAVKLSYFRLTPEQFEILQLLDGKNNIEQIRTAFHQKFATESRTASQIQQVVLDLYQQGLAWSTRPGQGHAMIYRHENQNWRQLKQALINVLFIRLPGFDPTKIIANGYELAKWFFHPAACMWAVSIIVYSWIFMATHAAELGQRLPSIESLTTWECTVSLWFVIGATKIIHELGHAFACRHFGGECHEIGMAFLIFSPCLYCDVSDSWTLPSKWQRIGIGLAGVYVELLVASLAFFGWWNAHPGTFQQFCFLTFVVSSISTLLFNLNPLLRLDGYYVLSDWLEIPNLRQKADNALENALLRFGMGFEVEPETIPKKTTLLFITYAVCSFIYRSFLVVIICCLLYSAFRPYRLEFVGLAVGVASAMLGILSWAKRIRTAVERHQDCHSRIKIWRPYVPLVFAGGIVALVFLVPIPISIKAPLQLEYASAQRVFASTNGQLAAIHVQPGETVRAGQTLLELFNFDETDQLTRLVTQKEVQEVEVRKQNVLADAKQTAVAIENLRAIESEIASHVAHLQCSIIRAPIAGTIIEPPARQADRVTKRQLSWWDGTPVDRVNLGCHLSKGTHLLTVAPGHEFQAVLRVSQLDIHSICTGQQVRIKLAHLPGQSFVGEVAGVSTTPIEPSAAGAKTRDARAGSPNAYQVVVRIDGDGRMFLPGIQGTAKVIIESQTAAAWIWRNVKSTFKFQI